MPISNEEVKNVAGRWEMIKDTGEKEELLVYEVNPWHVELAGKVDEQPLYDTDKDILTFKLDDREYIAWHMVDPVKGRMLAQGTCKKDTNLVHKWEAQYKGKYTPPGK